MQRDRLPNNHAPLRRDAFAQEELFRRVRAHDLEATRRGAEPLGQAEIVQDSAKKEEFFIEHDALRSGGKGPENEGSENMLTYRRVAFHLDQVQRCDGELAVWNPDSHDFEHAILRRYQNIVLALLEVAGTGCSMSQCSTILPSTSKRKISTPAVSCPPMVASILKPPLQRPVLFVGEG